LHHIPVKFRKKEGICKIVLSRRILIKRLSTLFLGSAFISACATGQSLLDPKTIAQQVANHYGEASPVIVSVKNTQTDNPPNDPMYLIALTGHFRKGSLVATSLTFSTLVDRMYVWDIRAYNASEPNQNVWMDKDLST
jgi:hypothetical protein